MEWFFAGVLLAVTIAVLLFFLPSKTFVGGRNTDFRPDRYSLEDLVKCLDVKPEDVRSFSPPVYREVHIPKRGGGTRLLEIPDSRTLLMQRRILHRVLNGISSHAAAVGFEQGKSIVDAAAPHVGKRVVIRVDIRRFFESTRSERVNEWLRSIGWDQNAAAFLTLMMTHNGHLPQGAATSPRLSNLVNARLDEGLQSVAIHFNGDYTRYADDITLSFNFRSGRRVRGILQVVRRILKMAGYQMHGRKTRTLRRHQRQLVLGLTVNHKVSVPRSIRRRLRAARHRAATGGTSTFTAAQLQGWSAYQKMVQEQSASE